VIDARGREFALCRVEDLQGEASEELREAVRKGNVHRWQAQVVGMFLGVAIGAVAMALILWVFGIKFRAGMLSGLVGGLLAGVIGAQGRAAAAGKAAVAECLKGEVCPGCGYSLKGIEGEERVCPECGGVWTLAAAKDLQAPPN
jgi:hypothetical protein